LLLLKGVGRPKLAVILADSGLVAAAKSAGLVTVHSVERYERKSSEHTPKESSSNSCLARAGRARFAIGLLFFRVIRGSFLMFMNPPISSWWYLR